MASSDCANCTFLQYIPYWLFYYSWHWILLLVYFNWYMGFISTDAQHFHQPSGPNATYWLESRGYLQSKRDARRLFILHLVLLALEPIEGYWILTGWYRLYLPGAKAKVSDPSDWEGNFDKYLCMALLAFGLIGYVIVGVQLISATLLHLAELWEWEPKEESKPRE